MQNSSEKICQKKEQKEEQKGTDKPVVPQAQKKIVQKVVKNPLMVKKNPLMKTEVLTVKQSQQKPIIQNSVPETKVKNKTKQVETEALVKQEQSSKVKQEVQEKSQVIKNQKTIEKDNPKDAKIETKVQQPKKELNSVIKDQNKVQVVSQKNTQIAKQTIPIKTQQISAKEDLGKILKKQQQKPDQKITAQKSQEKNESSSEKKDQKIVDQQKKLDVKEEPKKKEVKMQQSKSTNPLAAKKNPLIKSEMVFKPSQIKQTVNPLLPKPVEQQKTKEQPVKQQKQQVQIQTKIEKVEKKQKPIIQKIETVALQKKQENVPQTKQKKESQKVHEQTSQSKIFDNNRFSIGLISESKEEQKEMRNEVEVRVVDSVQKGTALSKYMVYQLEGKDKMGPFRIARKYSQFQAIRKIIRERWPGCFIPSIHSKSQLKNEVLKQKQIRIVLQNFLLGLSYSEHIFYKEEVQLFLRSPQIDIVQMVKQMPVLKAKDVINRYNSCFGEEMFQNVSQSQNSATIKKFTSTLRKTIASLSSISAKAQILSESYDNYATTLSRFGDITKNYEQLCLAEYTHNSRDKALIIKDQQMTKVSKLKELTKYNPFNKLYSFLNNETRDAQSFLEIMIAAELFILRKEELETQIKEIEVELEQISLGHKTLKTMTTRKSKQEVAAELQLQKKKLCEQKENIVQIYNITEIILAKKEIDFFKTFKRNTYRGVLKEWINVSAEINPELQELWKFVQDSAKQALKESVAG